MTKGKRNGCSFSLKKPRTHHLTKINVLGVLIEFAIAFYLLSYLNSNSSQTESYRSIALSVDHMSVVLFVRRQIVGRR